MKPKTILLHLLTSGAILLVSSCAKSTPEPTVNPTAAVTKNVVIDADYEAGYNVGKGDVTSTYGTMTYKGQCPDSHIHDQLQPTLGSDGGIYSPGDSGPGAGADCVYWTDSSNGPDQYHAFVQGLKTSAEQHITDALSQNDEAQASYYRGYLQGVYAGDMGH